VPKIFDSMSSVYGGAIIDFRVDQVIIRKTQQAGVVPGRIAPPAAPHWVLTPSPEPLMDLILRLLRCGVFSAVAETVFTTKI